MIHDEILWVEKYRPRNVNDCILPQRMKKTFSEYVAKHQIPNLILCGTAGRGKTTVAVAMCEEIGLNYLFINSSEERGIDTLRTKIANYASTVSLTDTHKVIILDEADGLTPDAQNALRGCIEKFSTNCTFILTCNYKAKLSEAIQSRCSTIDFTLQATERPAMAAAFFKRITEILTHEGVQYDKTTVIKIVEKYFPDFRKTIGELQTFAGGGSIDASVLTQITGIRGINELIAALKDKNFSEMRKWVTLNSDIDPSRIYRNIYDALFTSLVPSSIPQAVVIIAKYQYQAAFVPDQEINLTACLTEIMVDCQVK